MASESQETAQDAPDAEQLRRAYVNAMETRGLWIRFPKPLMTRLQILAAQAECSTQEVVIQLLEESFGGDDG